jgi:hypothetical protein
MKRPLAVAVIAWLYVAVGCLGFLFHLRPILENRAVHWDDFMVESTELVALVAGVFLLRGAGWARWLAVIWMAFHVAISFPEIQKVAVHGVMLVLIGYGLFWREAGDYFGVG